MIFLFDIGRVLLDFDFKSSLAQLMPADTRNPDERLDRLLQRKDELEAGLINAESYTRWALDILGSHATASQFHQAWQQIFTVNKPMWHCIRKLAADGHRLVLISNISTLHCPWIFDAYPEFSYFESAVLSFETGFIKPQPEIYQQAITAHELDPAHTFYIDDMPQNIAVGKRFGFHCWQYNLHNHHAFELWLEKALKSKIAP
ncbi:MAG: HAD-IA family hydrolase [Nitrosomonas sp.]|nr:HAD-IA family hydrolase [Nitrosomonas sp.]MDP1950490.1 HAD-IA family hydrolase [Nitrosomonas sp.]